MQGVESQLYIQLALDGALWVNIAIAQYVHLEPLRAGTHVITRRSFLSLNVNALQLLTGELSRDCQPQCCTAMRMAIVTAQ